MRLDLTVVPITFSELDWWLERTRIGLDRHYELFDAIKELPSQKLSSNTTVSWYDDDGILQKFDDCYGKSLRFVLAEQFSMTNASLWNTKWNLGILKFLRTIETDTPVVLYWH